MGVIPDLVLGLLLELGHPSEPANGSHTAEQPGQLSMGWHMGLDEDVAPAGINAACQIYCGRSIKEVLISETRLHVRFTAKITRAGVSHELAYSSTGDLDRAPTF